MKHMEKILGQYSAVSMLTTCLRSCRVHHAYIFHGPVGVGKFTTALAWAKVLLCQERIVDGGGGPMACGQCVSCQWFAPSKLPEGSLAEADPAHPDLHVIRKELAAVSSNPQLRQRKQLNIPIDLLRERLLGGQTSDQKYHSPMVAQTSHLGHGKVFVIDEAQLLDLPGQNALLKVLEEPPAETFLILVTSNLDRLLITIRSRCQPVSFGPLPDHVVADWLDRHASSLSLTSDPTVQPVGRSKTKSIPKRRSNSKTTGQHQSEGSHTELIEGLYGGAAGSSDTSSSLYSTSLSEAHKDELVRFAAGSLGIARLAVQYGLYDWVQKVIPAIDQMIQGRYPVDLGGELAAMIDAFAKRRVEKDEHASKDAANKLAARLMWSLIGQHARRQLTRLAQERGDPNPLVMEPLLGPWLGVIDALHQTQRELASNVNLGLVTDHLVSLMYRSLSRGGQVVHAL